MAPQEGRSISVSRLPHVQKNLNTFRATFQKPSHIYKFLKEIWKYNPLYLNRNLSYISKYRNTSSASNHQRKIDAVTKKLWVTVYKNSAERPGQNQTVRRNQTNGNSGTQCDATSHIATRTSNRINSSDSNTNICYYNWICSDTERTSQKTKSFGYICPWCERDLHHLDSLMTHLRCSHSRFCSNLVQEDNLPVIEMTLNPTYDGSYCGFKYPGHDLRRDFKFTPSFPERRMHFTQLLYFRPKRKVQPKVRRPLRLKSVEREGITCDEAEVDVDVCSGRLYYHTSTCLPIKINEIDVDSEADLDPEWLCERTQLMIDEFTDVNEGEKEILKLWNLHIMKNYKYKGDNMIRQACQDFVELQGPTIVCKNLYKNFTLHLANLYDFGLIGSRDMLECIRKLRKITPAQTKIRVKNEHCPTPAKRAALLKTQNTNEE